MSNAVEYERRLREALHRLKTAAPRAMNDLVRCASDVAQAVVAVTEGQASLKLVPAEQPDGATPTYQLQLRKLGSEAPASDLGMYRVTEIGYPVQRWYSRQKWEESPNEPTHQFAKLEELEEHFNWLVSNEDSMLVGLVSFFQQQPSPDKGQPARRKTRVGK